LLLKLLCLCKTEAAYGADRWREHIHNGSSHNAAVRALAFKWIRILFRCWKDGKPYDEQLYLQSLQKRNSPLKALLPSATGLGWKNVAGFQKFSDNPS
jgi:hypothetical protein